jgi:V/A-type H+-transporting ATPase subunit D
MALRTPPGRAGRPWLVRRIEIARRGAEVLDQKRQALVREQLRLEDLIAEAEANWRDAACEAARWMRRAAVLSGERPLRLARLSVPPATGVELTWRDTLGVIHPEAARLDIPSTSLPGSLGSAALIDAAAAHRQALEAAAAFAVLRLALDRIGAELARTVRRLRAIEQRWLPEHESALKSLDLALDERQREEAAQIRWARRRLRQPWQQ